MEGLWCMPLFPSLLRHRLPVPPQGCDGRRGGLGKAGPLRRRRTGGESRRGGSQSPSLLGSSRYPDEPYFCQRESIKLLIFPAAAIGSRPVVRKWGHAAPCVPLSPPHDPARRPDGKPSAGCLPASADCSLVLIIFRDLEGAVREN